MELSTEILLLSLSAPGFVLLLLVTLARLLRTDPVPLTPDTRTFLVLEWLALSLFTWALLHWLRAPQPSGPPTVSQEHLVYCDIETSRLLKELRAEPKYSDPRRLIHSELKVFSQFGEDGIIAEIFRRIGVTNRYFVEFGSADGMENNSVYLLRQGWSGLWLDGSDSAIARARAHFAPEIERGQLKAEVAFIMAENIEQLFSSYEVPSEPDLLSIDIDRNDYYIWKAIGQYRPRVVVIEYNAVYPPGIEWVVDYQHDAMWDGTSHFGASLSALETLGKEKGYALVGCCLAGLNAFFVRQDLLQEKFVGPFTAQTHYEPPRYWLHWGGHRRVP